MPIELSPEARQQAITSIERYFREQMKEPIGNMAAVPCSIFCSKKSAPASTTAVSQMRKSICKSGYRRWITTCRPRSLAIGTKSPPTSAVDHVTEPSRIAIRMRCRTGSSHKKNAATPPGGCASLAIFLRIDQQSPTRLLVTVVCMSWPPRSILVVTTFSVGDL